MTEVPLSNGLVAVIDDEDAAAVLAYRWHAQPRRHTTYAYRCFVNAEKKWSTQALHKFLTGYAVTDHVNGDGLDNRRANLRAATTPENGRNRRRGDNNTSGYKGVSLQRSSGRWVAHLQSEVRRLHLGRFSTPEEAARAYDEAARELYGDYAALNFPAPGERAS